MSPLYAKAGFVEVTSIAARERCTSDPFWLYDRNYARAELMDMVYVVSERGAAALVEHMARCVDARQPAISE